MSVSRFYCGCFLQDHALVGWVSVSFYQEVVRSWKRCGCCALLSRALWTTGTAPGELKHVHCPVSLKENVCSFACSPRLGEDRFTFARYPWWLLVHLHSLGVSTDSIWNIRMLLMDGLTFSFVISSRLNKHDPTIQWLAFFPLLIPGKDMLYSICAFLFYLDINFFSFLLYTSI